jgi:indole-3-glycerol phosphate synthase
MNAQGFLAKMANSSRTRAIAARAAKREATLAAEAAQTPQPPMLQLHGFDIIAELKLRSPAAGQLQSDGFDRDTQLAAYAKGGACAVSVLTEPDAFHGSLAHLADAAQKLRPFNIPVMRKDFLTDPYQVLEARAAGAGGVLIIVTMLERATIDELLDCAREQGLFVLLEGFDRDDLARIEELDVSGFAQPVLAGLNCRDLQSLQVDFARFAALADALPQTLPCVAESGVQSVDQIRSVATAGYRLALVGSSLMTAEQPAEALAAFVAAGRSARGGA